MPIGERKWGEKIKYRIEVVFKIKSNYYRTREDR